jgi:hypothetical protein
MRRHGHGTTAAVLISALAWLASAQNAELNCKIDDYGKIYLNGQQVVAPKKVGQPTADTTSMPITIVQGRNVLGIYCHDGGFTGGLIASIDLNAVGVPETIRTDATWKCTDGEPSTANWYTDPDFNDAAWRLAGEYGPLADDTGGNPKPFFERTGLEPFNLFMHRALWLWTPKPCYFRRSFTHTGTAVSVMLRGNGIQYKVYMNGTLVGQEATTIDRNVPLARWDNVATRNGENVIAIEAVCDDSIHFAWFKAGAQWSSTGKVLTDNTWKYSWDAPSGWRDPGFDDVSWVNTGTKSAYDPSSDPLTPASWIWPTDMSFRLVFDVPVVGVRNETRAMRAVGRVRTGNVSQYYTLRGELLPAVCATKVRGVLVEKSVLPDRHTVTRTVSAAKR